MTTPALVARLNAARTRIDRATALMQRALDLREMLEWQLDLDDMRDEAAAYRRAVVAYGRSARKGQSR